jgi:hypothetical protein
MPKQFGKLTAKEQKLVAAKFDIGIDDINKAIAKQEAASARARNKPKRGAARGLASSDGYWDIRDEGQTHRPLYPDIPVGKFEGAPHLVWIGPDKFRYVPDPAQPFRFIRGNTAKETIAPGEMFTDGGSIPRALWSFKDLSPWAYGPAFLIHDWLFELHHCGRDTRSFEEVRNTMMEGVKTLMETGVCERDLWSFNLIYGGIDSPVARVLWDRP